MIFDALNAGKSLQVYNEKVVHISGNEYSNCVLGKNMLPEEECSMFVVKHHFDKKQHF